MTQPWSQLAQRIVQAIHVQPGELIQLREGSGRFEVVQEIALALELRGATPAFEILPARYLERLWNEAPLDYLAQWDQHRLGWMEQYDRVIRLVGAAPKIGEVRQAGFQAWLRSTDRLTVREEARRLPFLVAAIPTAEEAAQLGLTVEELEAILLPALLATPEELRQAIAPVLGAVQGQRFTIRSGQDHELTLHHGDRRWHEDDGQLDDEDWARGAFVLNLPSGDIYTTVIEEATTGSLWLESMGEATEVTLHFEQGRIVEITAARGRDELHALFARHTGEPRRISHIGIGLNPYLHQPIGSTLVDEHIYGQLYFALGENRYMDGQNESSLNVDYLIPQATFLVDDRMIVADGKLVTDRTQGYGLDDRR
jgi:leucyl aminopeptidase (aminopeptidase T)